MMDMIDLPSFPSIIEYQVIEYPIYEIVILSEAEINKFTIMIIKEELKKHGIVPKYTSKKVFFSKLLQNYVEIRYPYVSNNIGQDGNTPGYGLPPTSYF